MGGHGERWTGERGAALAAVLMLLAIMSGLAVIVVEAANMSLRRTINQTQMEQARWYLMGAESFAAERIVDMEKKRLEAPIEQGEWQGRPFSFPLDEGAMTVTLWDGGNCFNLNGLVTRGESGALVADPGQEVLLARLFDLLDIRRGVEAMSLVASLTDWIDSDNQPGLGGVEEDGYSDVRYRVANTLLADFSELRRVRGFDDDIIGKIAPYTCVRPFAAPNLINPNTLQAEQASLLSMVFGTALPPNDAAELIRTRPRHGWADLKEFFAAPRLVGKEVSEPARALFAMQSTYYVAVVSVHYRDTRESSASLIRTDGGSARVLRRVFGAGDWKHAV